MIQEQLVDYINTQMKLGVSRDAIKTALTGAGWQAMDVEDTFKRTESAVSSLKPVTPPSAASPAPQTIKVSDLISSTPSSMSPSTMPAAKPMASKSPLTGTTANGIASAGAKSSDVYQQASVFPASKPSGSRGALVTEIILIVVIVAVGSFAGFLYMQNRDLNTQLGALNKQSGGVTSQLSSLQAEMSASAASLTTQVASLNAKSQELQTELSFYAAPANTAAGATSTAMVSGTVSGGGKIPYVITTADGAKISVANSKVASVVSALAPLVGTATATSTPATAQFFGTHVLGSDTITLSAVNGAALQ
jgi:hypothetical protein